MPRINFIHPQPAEPLEGIHIIADRTRGKNPGEHSPGKNRVPGKQQPVIRFVQADAPGTMAWGMDGPKPVVSKPIIVSPSSQISA